MAAQRVDFVVYYGEVTIVNIVELVILLHSEVLASLLHLRQYLLRLAGQNPLIQLLLLLDLSLLPGLIRNQLLIKLLPILLLLQLHHHFLLLLLEPLIPIIDLNALVGILVDIDDVDLALPDLLSDGGLHGGRSTL